MQKKRKNLLKRLADFHGHLGPYLIIGWKMGKKANEKLGKDPFEMKARVKTGNETPLSCIVDGIQFSTGCTLGKGNIEISNEKKPEAVFEKEDKKISLSLRKDILEKILQTSEDSIEELAEKMFKKEKDDFFTILEK